MNSIAKSELLFLYESVYSVPNGDPFTGEQRYDDETKFILVSDVRIKRYIRDHIAATNPQEIFVLNDPATARIEKSGDPESGAAARAKVLAQDGMTLERFKDLFDVRLFGGIVTAKKGAINLTGPVQFALLNPSLNRVDLRMHQNTSVFASSTDKTRGAIGTTTVVPYALMQIHGWINPFSAAKTGLTEADITRMFRALWDGINNANTRTKSNQSSLLLLQIIYSSDTAKVYGVDRLLHLQPKPGALAKRAEQFRSEDDYDISFDRLRDRVIASDKVKEVRYYTESEQIATALKDIGSPKLQAMTLP
jgi:CRISPR-associated protein Csh2